MAGRAAAAAVGGLAHVTQIGVCELRIQRKSNDPVCLLLTAYCSSTLLYGHIYRAARCGCPWRHCCSPSSGPQQQQQISLCIKREKPTRKHRRTTLTGSTRYSSSLLETTAYSARSSEPIPLWTLRTRANTQHRDLSVCLRKKTQRISRAMRERARRTFTSCAWPAG